MAAAVVASRAEEPRVVVASRAEEPRALGAPARAEEMGQATSTSSGAASWRYVQGSSAQGENAQGEAGKSINAKALDGTAPEAMSTLLHAAYGLENYPNYLLKWDRAKVDGHVAALEAQLAREEHERREKAEALAKQDHKAEVEKLKEGMRIKREEERRKREDERRERLASRAKGR